MNPLYFLCIIPLLAPFILLAATGRWTKDNLLPAAGIAAAGVLITALMTFAFTSYGSRDTEVLNGFVTGKEINRFTCPINTSNPYENGYDCNCRSVTYACGSDSKGNTTYCTRIECDTCYKYPWEQNFYVDSSLQGERAYKISRVDEQGAITPPRWTAVHRGDPVSITNTYTNYIMGAVDSLFAQDGQAEAKYKAKIPTYPLNIYDYYKIDRLVTVGKVNLDKRVWNQLISRTLVRVGPEKQANIVVVVAEGVEMDFANAVRRAWRGFKKNDIVVFIGVDGTGNVTWSRVMSWSKASIVNVKMEMSLLEQFEGKQLEPVAFMQTVQEVSLAHFQRRSMEEFAYLKNEAKLSDGQVTWFWILFILLQGGSIAAQMYLHGIGPFARYNPYSSYNGRGSLTDDRLYKLMRQSSVMQVPARTINRARGTISKTSRFRP